jgi:hypothetical protein
MDFQQVRICKKVVMVHLKTLSTVQSKILKHQRISVRKSLLGLVKICGFKVSTVSAAYMIAWEVDGMAPLILNLRTRWGWVVTFTTKPHWPRKRFGNEVNLQPQPVTELRFLEYSAPTLFTILTELPRFIFIHFRICPEEKAASSFLAVLWLCSVYNTAEITASGAWHCAYGSVKR